MAAGWLAVQATPGSGVRSVWVTVSVIGYMTGLLNLVPFTHGSLRSDGQLLLDLGRWAVTGRTPPWMTSPSGAPADPNAATSVPPPGAG